MGKARQYQILSPDWEKPDLKLMRAATLSVAARANNTNIFENQIESHEFFCQ